MPDAPNTIALADIRQSFAEALPRIEGLARAYLGFQRDKDDAVAETVALAWKAYRDLALRGRDVVKLLGRIVVFSAKRVRCGRRLVGAHPARDVLAPVARVRHGFVVASLPLSEGEDTAPDILAALRREGTSPADEAAFRIDLEAWLDGLDERRWRVAQQLASGLNTQEVSRLHGVTRARIAQLRVDLIAAWERFNAR